MAAKRAGNRGKGRPKGTPNKTTKAVKEALIEAFDKAGGVPALTRFAKKNPAAFYTLWSKLLPTEVKTSGKITVRVEIEEEVVEPHDGPSQGEDSAASGAT